MIEIFSGEFLVSPVPLQLSLNYCSHSCSYCFANLNKPNRAAKSKEIQSQLKNYHNQNNLVANLMREKYPVLISNLVDPFATSNYGIAVPVMEQLTDLEIPVCIQTRGGRGVDDVLSFLKPSLWYISIPTLDDAVRKRIEPGAPTIQSRLGLIEKLLSLGHKVVVGANPMDWIGDHEQYVRTLKGLGVSHVWIGLLHFSHEQVRNMPDWSKKAIGDETLSAITGKRSHPEHQIDAIASMIEVLEAEEMTWFSTECLFTTEFFDLYGSVYKKAFPTISQFLSRAQKANPNNHELTLESWLEYAVPLCPSGTFHMPGYLFNRDRNVYEKNPHWPKKMSYRQLLTFMWNTPKWSGIPYFREGGVLIEADPNLPGEVRYSTDPMGNLRYQFHDRANAEEYALVGTFTPNT